jgi:LuxR family transcriptional regulator, quorum-sensing system regulator CciR
VRSAEHLKELLHEISERMGFRYFALTHHIDLRSNPAGGVQVVNYPQGWVDRFYSGLTARFLTYPN